MTIIKKPLDEIIFSNSWIIILLLISILLFVDIFPIKNNKEKIILDRTYENIDEILVDNKIIKSYIFKDKKRVRLIIYKNESLTKNNIIHIKILNQGN
jgi:hypothetical protein